MTDTPLAELVTEVVPPSDAWIDFLLDEWDWVVFANYGRLHHVERYLAGERHGRTSCGRGGELLIPGMFTRMGTPRCRLCCDRMGYPRGVGSPKNDDAVRPLVEAHLAEGDHRHG